MSDREYFSRRPADEDALLDDAIKEVLDLLDRTVDEYFPPEEINRRLDQMPRSGALARGDDTVPPYVTPEPFVFLSGSPIRGVPVYRAPARPEVFERPEGVELEQYGLKGKVELPGTPDLSGLSSVPKSIRDVPVYRAPELEQ